MQHIFERFYRSSSAVKAIRKAGLGLYAARAIVEARRPRARAPSEGPVGARISFSATLRFGLCAPFCNDVDARMRPPLPRTGRGV
jgi:signal transduction histidine kinase